MWKGLYEATTKLMVFICKAGQIKIQLDHTNIRFDLIDVCYE